MPINEKGEFIRDNNAPEGKNHENEKILNESRELADRQDSEPEPEQTITAEKKAEMRRRLLGE